MKKDLFFLFFFFDEEYMVRCFLIKNRIMMDIVIEIERGLVLLRIE